MVKAKFFIKKNEFSGEPKLDDFELKEEELLPLQSGQFLIEAQSLSVDPYMRIFSINPGSVMIGGQVAKVIESKNAKFPIGTYVYADVGWRTHTIVDLRNLADGQAKPYLLDFDFGKHPKSLALGVCGMPGNSAYFGFLEICKPKPDEVLVVTAAAGAVGSLVGQIGKIKGMTVIGVAGTDKKCDWLKNELNFDHAINYKTSNVSDELKKLAPNGIDCYFDNVGGELASIIISQMREFGRISVCGSISGYNDSETLKVPLTQIYFVRQQLSMEGFMVNKWLDRWTEGIQQMLDWVKEGKIKYEETITEGFDNMPRAFIEMLNGANTGKAIIKIQ